MSYCIVVCYVVWCTYCCLSETERERGQNGMKEGEGGKIQGNRKRSLS